MELKLKNNIENSNQEIRIKNRIIFIQLLIIVLALYKFSTYPKQLTVYTAPDISKAFVQKADDASLHTVYGFSRTIWETINFCEKDCYEEYPQQLERYRGFLTKACYTQLSDHFRKRRDLYDMRSRRLLPTDASVYSAERVKKVANGVWYTYQQYLLDDDIGGIETRKQIMEYPLKVVSSGVPTISNPWGLSIDCFWEEVKVIKYETLDEIK